MSVKTYRSKCGLDLEVLWINGAKRFRVPGGGLRCGYTQVMLAAEPDGAALEAISMPYQWLVDNADLRRVYTAGVWISKAPPEKGESFDPPGK